MLTKSMRKFSFWGLKMNGLRLQNGSWERSWAPKFQRKTQITKKQFPCCAPASEGPEPQIILNPTVERNPNLPEAAATPEQGGYTGRDPSKSTSPLPGRTRRST